MLKEVLDLLDRDLGQVGIVFDVVVTLSQAMGGHGDHFFVMAPVVFHNQYAHRSTVHDCARHNRSSVTDQHVDRVAVLGQCMGNEAVVTWVDHRGIQETVDE